MLALNDDLVVLAADIHPQRATVAMVDLNGRLLSRSTLPLASDPAKAVPNIIACMKRIQESHASKSLEGVGISVPGRVDTESQSLIFAPNLKWRKFDIKQAIERGLGLPTEMENAATSCLMSELWFGKMDGIRDAVLITVSEGLGAGIMANGLIVSGQHGMAGEFGHIPIDPSGPLCACKQRGCLETFASCRAALRYYSQMVPKAKGMVFLDLLSLAEEGDTRAVAALAKQATYIGKGLRIITAALAPEVVLVAGDVTSAWGRFAPIIEKELASFSLAGNLPRLQATHEGEIARLRGAAALFLQRHSIRSELELAARLAP
jgi:predicted NBD/HSP70 family sugar kinase